MTGIVAFRKVQWGKETSSARGTAVACTRQILAKCNVPKDRTVTLVEDQTGRRGGAIRSRIGQFLADPINLEFPEAYYQGMPGIFSIGLKGVAATSTTGPSYTWTFTPEITTTAGNNVHSMTLRLGDDTEQYMIPYVQARMISVSGRVGEDGIVSVAAECYGRQVNVSAFTAGLTTTGLSMEPIVSNLALMYSDANWAALGGTQVTATLVDWKIDINTGMHPKFFADGQRYFSTVGQGKIGAVATFTFEGNSTADAFFDDFQAATPRAIRLKIVGSRIGSGGLYHTLQIDLYGKFTEVIPMGSDRDGNSLHTAVFETMDDNAATPHCLAVTVITSVNAF